MSDLLTHHCRPCEGGVVPLDDARVKEALGRDLPGWELHDGQIVRTFRFRDFHETMAFVNGIAWIAHVEDHHPDLEVGFSTCRVRYQTHAIGGISENDLICAAKVDALLQL